MSLDPLPLLPAVAWIGLGGLLGAIFGSFVGAALVRLPAGRSPLVGRSRCDGCGRALTPGELVPVLSFLMLGGRCRSCKAPIDRWQFAAELGGVAVGASAAAAAASGPAGALSLALGLQLLLLGLLDLRHLWLPDRLVALLAATGLAAALLRFGWTPAVLSESLGGGLLGFALLWLPAAIYRRARRREGMGAGDPKLLAALGLWLGPLGTVLTLLAGTLGGLAVAAGMALTGRQVGAQTVLPLGSLLALAGWIVWLLTAKEGTWR